MKTSSRDAVSKLWWMVCPPSARLPAWESLIFAFYHSPYYLYIFWWRYNKVDLIDLDTLFVCWPLVLSICIKLDLVFSVICISRFLELSSNFIHCSSGQFNWNHVRPLWLVLQPLIPSSAWSPFLSIFLSVAICNVLYLSLLIMGPN